MQSRRETAKECKDVSKKNNEAKDRGKHTMKMRTEKKMPALRRKGRTVADHENNWINK